jgi:hypothetical protein
MDNKINSDSDLEQKLKDVGYEKTEFEPIVRNRFIAKVDGIPSFVICGVSMPLCSFYRNKEHKTVEPRWEPLTLH